MTTQLRQMENQAQVTGVLKSLALKEADGKKIGTKVIRGNVTVEFEDKDGNINNVRGDVWVSDTKKNGEHNKMYDSYSTILKEYKDIDNDGGNNPDGGREAADKVTMQGEFVSNDYYDSRDNLREGNSVRVSFLNREKEEYYSPKASVVVEAYVDGYTDEMDSEGEPTGRKQVDVYTVGYGGRVTQIQNAFVESNLASQFEGIYYPGSTGELTLHVHNYAQVEKTEVNNDQVGFGQVEEVRAVTNYVNEVIIVGGKVPFEDDNALTEEEIALVKKTRKETIASLPHNSTNKKEQQGFGSEIKVQEKPVEKTEQAETPSFDKASSKDEVVF